MRLIFKGHDYKYAAEQMLLTLFPGERPVYEGGEGSTVTLAISRGKTWLTATAVLDWAGKRCRASARAEAAQLNGEPLNDDRVRQRILKLAFYRAGTAALGREPPWGAMTGVRPVKIPAKAMAHGATEAEAEAVLREVYRVSPSRRRLAMDCAKASLAARASLKRDEISLYIGIPFCPTRCAYCSFVSADVGRSLKLVEPFLELLCREIADAGTALRRLGLSVRTVYIGGGTPTTLTAAQLSDLLEQLERYVDLSRCSEFTVEAGRPDTITAEKLCALRAHGVDRVSVNPQSMSDAVLAAMGRAHTAGDVLRAWELVCAAGFSCVNMDLIAGLPADTASGFRASLDQVMSLGPENITVHTLALKKGSRLMLEGGALPAGEEVHAMLDYAWETLGDGGYVPYYLYRQKYMSGSFENVGWSRPGFENLYNLCMMEELHSVLALGGGGVTKLVDARRGRIVRIANPKYPYEYLNSGEKLDAKWDKMTAFQAEVGKER